MQGVMVISGDVTLHKQAEQTLRESEERHRLLVETMGQGIVQLSMNPAAERILGKMQILGI